MTDRIKDVAAAREMTRAEAPPSNYERKALADRHNGVMPSWVRERDDAIPLWAAFRRYIGTSWSGRQALDFTAGWDAARNLASSG